LRACLLRILRSRGRLGTRGQNQHKPEKQQVNPPELPVAFIHKG
jgi:hypothetical protein